MELYLTTIFLLILLGFLTGTIAVIAGIGGGVFFVSIMTLLFLMPINIAIDTSTFIILASSCAGFITYLKQGRTNFKLALTFGVFSILGSVFATILFSFIQIDNSTLKILFALTLLVAGLNMIHEAIKTKGGLESKDLEKGEFSLHDYDYKTNLKKVIPLFILAGFVANLLGIGGGIINTPSLNIILGFPIHNATAISTSIIFFTAIYNTIIKCLLGQIDYLVGLLITSGAILGSIFGAKISRKMSKTYLKFLVAIILLVLAIRMFF